MEERRLAWIELTRTFAMIFVVLCHAHDMVSYREDTSSWWSAAFSAAFRFAVPLFFLISGYLAGRNLPAAGTKAVYTYVFRHRIAPVMVNFVAWNVIYIFLMKLLLGVPLWSLNALWNLTTGSVHLFFIFVLIQLFLLYPLAHPFLDRHPGGKVIAWAAALSVAFYFISDFLLWTRGADGYFFEWHWGKLFAAWSLFYFFGAWLSRRRGFLEGMSRNIIPLAATSAASFVPYLVETHLEAKAFGYYPRGYFLASGIGFQFLCANLVLASAYRLDALGIRNILTDRMIKSGVDTYGIYLSHYAFVMALGFLLKSFASSPPPGLGMLSITVIAWAASQNLVRAMRRPRLGAINRILFR